jgi:hypothetical protein
MEKLVVIELTIEQAKRLLEMPIICKNAEALDDMYELMTVISKALDNIGE